MMLFTKEFLDKLQEQCGAKSMLDKCMEDGMSFHDSVLKIAHFHLIEPEYVSKGYSCKDEGIRLLIDTYQKNITAKPDE